MRSLRLNIRRQCWQDAARRGRAECRLQLSLASGFVARTRRCDRPILILCSSCRQLFARIRPCIAVCSGVITATAAAAAAAAGTDSRVTDAASRLHERTSRISPSTTLSSNNFCTSKTHLHCTVMPDCQLPACLRQRRI